MHTFSFSSTHWPDGVEIHDYGPEPPRRKKSATIWDGAATKVGSWFRPRTGRGERIRLDVVNLENPIVVSFINARDEKALGGFFCRYGFPIEAPEYELAEAEKGQAGLDALVKVAGSGDPVPAIKAVNDAMHYHRSFYLIPTLDLAATANAPRITFAPQSLFSLMLLETAMIVINDARYASCEHCARGFLTGPLTGRRSHARYCSDRCRVAAMRARNASQS